MIWLWVGLFFACVGILLRPLRHRLPLPPGPRGLPVIGNILDYPASDLGRGFRALAARYGSLVHLKILGHSIVAIDSYDTARELLDKRSRNYADRPDAVMARLTSLTEFNLPLMRYGQAWRTHRRFFHQTLSLKTFESTYRPHIRKFAHDLLQNLLDNPKDFSRHIHHAFAASVLNVGYGIEVSKDDDKYVNMLHSVHDLIEDAVVPGKYLVELFPTMQRLPSWFPGTRFRSDALFVRKGTQEVLYALYEEGKRRLASGNAKDSMLSATLQRTSNFDSKAAAEEEEICAGALMTTYMAGSDTTMASLRAFFLAMTMYPDVQKKAQVELDRVIGHTRLPDFEDRGSLPYLNAIVKELTRWHVVAPIGLPHAALEDDEYNGLFIPRGAMIISNFWSYSRDPDVYPDPETFDPERFLQDGKLNSGARDPYAYIFGLGRRVCPGRHLADASLFLACASILHAFNITPPLDENGHPVKLEAKVTTGLVISHPEEFECIVESRSAESAYLVRA
ncbi:CyP450 monooxygenase [Trametes versicolor FP-101664 SS1]|uniref:CyP450 monooxygenase n=1 Tax=Trametes versicolor (strain FP-101664) TaxID=717944 RepID=UPI0004624875|nr:CyP450 monooxygenase [Trametes versicolor FP-101664 SS1]EIW58876.1 CyP450 monooxygenase [Trametes versicolor FP-101664 SS1]